jgi:hypothetical protein
MSSRGRLSSPPPETEEVDSDVLTVFFGAAEAPWRRVKGSSKPYKTKMLRKEFDLQLPITSNGFLSYSASSALSSAGLTSARNPLISANREREKRKYISRIHGMWKINNNKIITHQIHIKDSWHVEN